MRSVTDEGEEVRMVAACNAILASHTGTRLFAEALDRAERGSQFMRLLGRYVQFNAIFGSGVASLAGQIGARPDLFRDPKDPVPAFADRNAEVAAAVFFAAVDEFVDTRSLKRGTHRSLAQATAKGAGKYLGLTSTEINESLCPDAATNAAIDEVKSGYGLSQVPSEEDLLRGIGFHLGSETLADEEFRSLDDYLRRRRPELVDYLARTEVLVGGQSRGAYLWIKIHTTAEAEHSEAGEAAVALALEYYAGTRSNRQVEDLILEGFSRFAALQTRFMASLSHLHETN